MQPLKTNIYLKIFIITGIGMLLLIPATLIRELIYERENTQNQAISEVSAKWAYEQTLSGPFVSIPYVKYLKEYVSKDSTEKILQVKDFIHILPEELTISGQIQPEKRNRGIYEIVVYNSVIHVSGKFTMEDLAELDIPENTIQFDKARLTTGINDLRGIEEQISLTWNGGQSSFNPGVISNQVVTSGINAPVNIGPDKTTTYAFSFDLNLKGSQLLYFTPVGKTTSVTIHSSWQNPSFNGAFLPDTRTVSDTGFTAHWNVLHLNRNYPQIWKGSGGYALAESSFGINLLLPVDNYQKSYRSVRYAILFIGFTFLAFFFIEVLNRIFIHPVQYILVGIALVVFFVLLLSISEHIPFNLAFIISATATLLLIAGYVKAILKSGRLTGLISGILLILYSFIFVVIQLQDLALLIGSIGIFIILGIVMYLSRQIDWYNLNIKDKAGS
ncbi:MAG: cell envelope integrity protein CreD [Bacteroidia bacterium]